MAILSVCDATYRYQSRYQTVDALKGVTCSFAPGTMYAIVGKSGSGKTTLLSLLAGLDLPTGGSVRLGEQSTAELDRNRYRRSDVAVIYQSYNLFPLLTVLENTAYPLEIRGEKEKQARETARRCLRQTGLDASYEKRFPSMLSGGEQQRVAIARALASGAAFLLADEPTGNLDVENSQNIVSILRALAHEEGRCVVIVTHDPMVAEVADVVLRMTDGRLAEEPQPESRP